MPTSTGGETIGEKLTRLRADLTRLRESLARIESNGSSYSLGGEAITQGSYETFQRRERELVREIRALELRLSPDGGVATSIALTVTC